MSEEFTGDELSDKLLPAVEEQMSSAETAFVKEHYDRLVADGEEAQEAKKMIALCLVDEVEQMQQDNRAFNIARYEQMLQFLPVLPE